MDYRFACVKDLEEGRTQLCKPLDRHSFFLPQVDPGDDEAIKRCEPHNQLFHGCLQP